MSKILHAGIAVLALAPSAGSAYVIDGPSLPFVNELHYDNTGSDVDEGVEIAGPAGLDLGGFSLLLYNGSTGAVYDTRTLSGILPDQDAGFGTLAFGYPSGGLQNGAPDGLALVSPTDVVLQLLSYEGVFVATNGAAVGLTTTDIGVGEADGTPPGFSLQLAGLGAGYGAFQWQAAEASTWGQPNAGQAFGAVVPVPAALPFFASALISLLGVARRRRMVEQA